MATETSSSPLLRINDLSVSFRRNGVWSEVIRSVSLTVNRGRVLAIVGESGSGKTVSSLACMGLLPAEISRVNHGQIIFGQDLDLLSNASAGAKTVRGKRITMIFQEPMSSLNPSMRVGDQIAESILQTRALNASDLAREVVRCMAEVELPSPEQLQQRYPHELSGGQKQRVMIAMALAVDPDLIIADEPTTALDVTVQKSILSLLHRLQRERQLAMIFISHDLELVAEIADDLAVMYKGEVVESGSAHDVLRTPSHPYTRALLACKPSVDGTRRHLLTLADALGDTHPPDRVYPKNTGKKVVLEATNLRKSFVTRRNIFGRPSAYFEAVKGVSFDLFEGETLGIVGESGCGKSTVSRMIMGLTPIDGGTLHWYPQSGEPRPIVQLVFQDPYASLNPRITAVNCLIEALVHSKQAAQTTEARSMALALMQEVGLPAEFADRYPHAFSGGQRQRLVIARALCANPKVLILDESVAALDISVQAQVLNLLNQLKVERQLTFVFISHDLRVVAYMSDRVMVMYQGRIEEIGDAASILTTPKHAYTQKLLASIPGISTSA
jgi:peptide/nickel transport system ATP-binding protein